MTPGTLQTLRGRKDYPTSDGRPMAETDYHRDLMMELIQTLDAHYANDPQVYVSGNILVFYEPGNRRRHVSPDVLVVKGVPKGQRLNYLIWEEDHTLDLVIELTSSSTRDEDVRDKMELYQDTLKVKEYFLFDPLGDYLDPRLRGYRLRRGRYGAIKAVRGRLPSKVLGLHLEQHGEVLRLYDPTTKQLLPTMQERAEQAEQRAEQLEQRTAEVEERAARAEEESERLRRELEELRRRLRQRNESDEAE
jgi:Uma2 family endonuclease